MSEKQAATQAKSKHGHAASQAQPAPRKVRFNVGACSFRCGGGCGKRSAAAPEGRSTSEGIRRRPKTIARRFAVADAPPL